MGADETFARDTDDREVIVRELLRLSARVAGRMRTAERGRPHRHPQGPVRRLHHHHPLAHPARGHRRDRGDPPRRRPASTTRSACSAPGSGWSAYGWRGWSRAPRVHRQLVLGEPEHGWAEADRAVDRATRRFGAAAVRPASLV